MTKLFHTTRRAVLGSVAVAATPSLAHAKGRKPKAMGFTDIKTSVNEIGLRHGDMQIIIRSVAPGAIEVVKTAAGAARPDSFFGNAASPIGMKAETSKGSTRVTVADIDIHVDHAGTIAFSRTGAKTPAISDTGAVLKSPGVSQAFTPGRDSPLYGLGQFRDPVTDYRGGVTYLAQANSDAVNPVLVSRDGWGILWDTHTHAWLDTKRARLSYDSPDGAFIRYYVLIGDGLDGVIAAYRRTTGNAPLLGKWAYGYWQSQERYRSQDELLTTLDGYRARKLPIDVMVQDWRYWGENDVFSGMVWDKQAFPDPKGMCAAVHAKNAHVVASVWPAFGPKSEVFRDLDSAGLLFKGQHWSGGRVLDITSPKARDIYWGHIEKGLISVGLDGLWTDGSEPEFMSTGSRYVTMASYAANGQCAAGPIRDNLMTFSYYQTHRLYDGMRAYRPAQRPLILTRSVYAGQQAFNAVTWSGDIFASWQTLKNQVLAAQQISLSGLPYWTCDIGGFLATHRFPDGPKDEAYRELYVRWFQFGSVLPIFRAHGTEFRRDLMAFGNDGDPAYDALKAALLRRYALMPYIYTQAARVTQNDDSFLRPLVMDFADDARIAAHPYQYMLGRDLMTAIVTTPLEHAPDYPYEFIPNSSVIGENGPAPKIEFYEGAKFERLVDTRRSDDIKMSWSGDLPVVLSGKPYSARWTGKIIATENGLHRFQIMTQGLIRFSLDGAVKVQNTGSDQGHATDANGGVSFKGHTGDDVYRFEMVLEKGRAYGFELTQSQPTPDVVSLWVEWETPSHRAEMLTSPGKTVDIYLPGRGNWYAFGTAERHAGGSLLKVRPALADMPLFAREGAIIPQTPGIQYAQAPVTAMDIHVYAGRDGQFDLYDDAGDGHAYEGGAFRHWPLRWDDKRRVFSALPARGDFAGTFRTLMLNVTVFDGASGTSRTGTVTADAAAPLSISFA